MTDYDPINPETRSSQSVFQSASAGAFPQPLPPVMQPTSQPCGYCYHPLIEKNCQEHMGTAYIFYQNSYYHQECLSKLLSEYSKQVQANAKPDS